MDKRSSETDSLILASGSPRRRELLAQLGLPFDVVVSNEPEPITPGLAPEALAIHLAAQKARAVAANLASGLVLGADTIVVLDGDILGKPADDENAARMLRRLSGRAHEVITGVALLDAATGSTIVRSVTSRVWMHALGDEQIAAYVATGEPRDKAGAYAIQGLGGELVARYEGCFNNVVGLPLCYVSVMLAHMGVAMPSPGGLCRQPDGTLCSGSV